MVAMSPAEPSRPALRAVLALKPLELAKSRLGRPDAPALVAAMFGDVVSATIHTPQVDETVVVCGDSRVADLATAGGARALPDPGGGLNAAYRSALDPSRDTLIVQADLPALRSEDLGLIVAAARTENRVALLADAAGTGTALLWIPAGASPLLSFGTDSRRAHALIGTDLTGRHLAARGPDALAARRDIDTEADLTWFAENALARLGPRTANWFAAAGFGRTPTLR